MVISSPRPCNVGPAPPVNEEKLAANLRHRIDNTSRDADMFEWGSLASVSKGGACPYAGIAEKADLVMAHLHAAPAARITGQCQSSARAVPGQCQGSARAVLGKCQGSARAVLGQCQGSTRVVLGGGTRVVLLGPHPMCPLCPAAEAVLG